MKVSRSNSRFFSIIEIAFAFWIGFSSCIGAKKLHYFKDLPDSTHVFLPPLSREERVIEYRDQLNIVITAAEKEAVAYFNSANSTGMATTSGATTSSGGGGNSSGPSAPGGYVVNSMGYVEFPIIGQIKVLGLTERQLKDHLTQLISKYVKDPLVDVRFTSFRVTVLGEVESPGTYTLDMQHPNVFQALAIAGDLPMTARRSDIQLYRNYNGERVMIRFDLRKKEVLYDPEVFELRHNDVIYVKPFGRKFFIENFTFIATLVASLTSLISIAYILAND